MSEQHAAAIDMRERLRPSGEQVRVATAMLAAAADSICCVAVGLALPGKTRGIWDAGQAVEHAEGFWLADRDAWDGAFAYHCATHQAELAALRQLGSRPGQTGYAIIRHDGSWSVWEGFVGDERDRARSGSR
ncbi:MAG TPA: hypothetical protein VFM37_17820 [Pseudonocardiaceae bacterium]|nr:hypothetical protein [Pseudonocardiaceae bacterium]